ncbi:MAG: glycosyltransferase, partial [Candidatus Omnitrophica bacterium]|nr:glycosyltransferase [Candidatus Omnitrophota bacterium]
RKYYRWLLPLLPYAIESLVIRDADLVISSSHCVAKGVRVPAGARHVCYCHTPMRYIWGFQDVYFRTYPYPVRRVIHMVLDKLKTWDLKSNEGVHHFMCNSENVEKRIRDFYGREAKVIYPPLDTNSFYPPEEAGTGDYYLVVSALVPYKRVDLVIEAFNALDRKLIVVGSGPLAPACRKLRKNEKIFFLESVSDTRLRELYAGAKALIFPTDEDFGIVPLEAQACGTPVIALGRGGALESVRKGIFFNGQTAEDIRKAVSEIETMTFDRREIARSVDSFNKNRFKDEIKQFIETLIATEGAHAHHP